MKFFQYDNDNALIDLNVPEILLIKEFEALYKRDRNRAFQEFKYIYFTLDWGSPYFNIPIQEREEAARIDSGLSEEEIQDELLSVALKKYDEIQNSSIAIRLLKSAMNSVETVIFYLNNVDVSERDPLTGKPVFKTKDLIAEIKGCKDLIDGLKSLEDQVKKEIDPGNGLRGDVEAGAFD